MLKSALLSLAIAFLLCCSGRTEDEFAPQQATLPAAPPKDAIVLFDGAGKNLFLSKTGGPVNWKIDEGALVSTPDDAHSNHIVSRLHFRDAEIHVEFLVDPRSGGNSGVYLHGNYELQIFNSFGKAKPTMDDMGAVYGFVAPLVNAARQPGEWQVYDIRYRAPRRDAKGNLAEDGVITAWLNGQKVQNGAKVGQPRSNYHPFRYKTTPYLDAMARRQAETGVGPVFLQDHGSPTRFRNVWVRPLDDKAFLYEPGTAQTSGASGTSAGSASDNQHCVAIKNVCAWPNLMKLPDGTIVATIHNRPSHGGMEGDVECWASSDGIHWTKRGHPAPNDPQTVRMNVAAGLAGNGDLLVLCSGWTNQKQPPRPKQAAFRDDILSTWVCRSADGGHTWTQAKMFPAPDEGWTEYIPFGDVVAGDGGALHVSCYGGEFVDPTKSTKTKGYRAWHFRSDDDGRTWRRTSTIGAKHNETHILRLDGKRWLAAARIDAVELFRSDDDGETWMGPQRVTGRNEINGHLLRLRDGRLVLSYGNRVKDQFGVLARLSSDEGRTWSEPIRLAESLESDCGYPSSVQRGDGRIVTAYYSRRTAQLDQYHMATAIWQPASR